MEGRCSGSKRLNIKGLNLFHYYSPNRPGGMQGELIRKERGGMRKLKRDEDRGQRKREISKQSDINHNNHILRARHDKEEKERDRAKERKVRDTIQIQPQCTATGIVVMLIY